MFLLHRNIGRLFRNIVKIYFKDLFYSFFIRWLFHQAVYHQRMMNYQKVNYQKMNYQTNYWVKKRLSLDYYFSAQTCSLTASISSGRIVYRLSVNDDLIIFMTTMSWRQWVDNDAMMISEMMIDEMIIDKIIIDEMMNKSKSKNHEWWVKNNR